MKNTKEVLRKRFFFLIDFSVSEYFSTHNNPYITEYVSLAFDISKKIKLKVPKEVHQKVCKKCYTIRDSNNTKIRTIAQLKNSKKNKYLKIHCKECDYIKKIKI